MTEETFGPYRIEQLLGRGGMGEVHRAYDLAHDRVVALKRLSPGHHDDEEYRARFRREARIVARLREPHVIPIHAYGEIDGRLYLDMRLVEGSDLADLIRDVPLEPLRAVRIVEQVASALDAAHADGLVHRDVKPSNILVTPGDFVYLVDFGIARSVSPGVTGLTASGSVVGTLDYMAPERFERGFVDGRADVYALACVLFASVAGRRPFTAESTAAQIWAHMNEPPPSAALVNPAVPVELDEVIAKGMAKNPADRYATAGEFAKAAAQALASATPAIPPGPTEPAHPQPDPPTRVLPSAAQTRELIILGAAVIVVMALIATGLIITKGNEVSGDGTSSSTSTTSTTSSPTTTTTTRSPQLDALFAALPDPYRTSTTPCVPATPDSGEVAAVRCTRTNSWDPRTPPPAEAEFRLFADRATQDAYFQALVGSRGIPRMDARGGCRPKSDPIHYALYYRDTSGPLPGEFTTCFLDNGIAQVWWVDTRTLVVGGLKRPGDIDTLDDLDLWWNEKILSEL